MGQRIVSLSFHEGSGNIFLFRPLLLQLRSFDARISSVWNGGILTSSHVSMPRTHQETKKWKEEREHARPKQMSLQDLVSLGCEVGDSSVHGQEKRYRNMTRAKQATE